jgi:hypothetical protein
MPKIEYVRRTFSSGSLAVIEQANAICEDYVEQGYDLTLRQLYYQFVARDLIPNRQSEYKRLGSIINDARLAGLIDWNHLVDRTRSLRSLSHWDDPSEIIDASADQYRTDLWGAQEYRVEVWVEKDALTGVIGRTADRLDCPWFSCRGYTSQSELWAAARRHLRYEAKGQKVIVIHLGDHDPSGVDMSRDIADRLALFGTSTTVQRIALNMSQVRQYNPPPNPAKMTDSRTSGYIQQHGTESWELDALNPEVLDGLITDAVQGYRDEDVWEEGMAVMRRQRRALQHVAQHWDRVQEYARDLADDEN